MTKIKIKDNDALINTVGVISWLDSWRWNTQNNDNFIKYFRSDLTKGEEILTHWICYITDRQMPFEIVWDIGGLVFSEVVYEYSRNKLSPKQILDGHYEDYEDKEGKKRYRFKSVNNGTFASRYVTDDYQSILQTLEILDNPKYERNIVRYITDIIRRFQSKEDLLIRVACGLHLLTYQLDGKKADSERAIRILSDDMEFDKKLIDFKRNSTIGKKRLWCCVRDYKKGLYHEVFDEAIREVSGRDADELINKWNNLPLNQIELPGDVWNNSPLFKNNLIGKLIDINEIPKTWEMPKIVREIYEQLKDTGNIDNFYPEQFDITFDFVPRMCDKKRCNVCLFGPNGAESICIPTNDKYCPVALVSCGYIANCKGNQYKCIIKENIGKGICKGGLKKETL